MCGPLCPAGSIQSFCEFKSIYKLCLLLGKKNLLFSNVCLSLVITAFLLVSFRSDFPWIITIFLCMYSLLKNIDPVCLSWHVNARSTYFTFVFCELTYLIHATGRLPYNIYLYMIDKQTCSGIFSLCGCSFYFFFRIIVCSKRDLFWKLCGYF